MKEEIKKIIDCYKDDIEYQTEVFEENRDSLMKALRVATPNNVADKLACPISVRDIENLIRTARRISDRQDAISRLMGIVKD